MEGKKREMFKKIIIENSGEIDIRVIRDWKEMGIKKVEVN